MVAVETAALALTGGTGTRTALVLGVTLLVLGSAALFITWNRQAKHDAKRRFLGIGGVPVITLLAITPLVSTTPASASDLSSVSSDECEEGSTTGTDTDDPVKPTDPVDPVDPVVDESVVVAPVEPTVIHTCDVEPQLVYHEESGVTWTNERVGGELIVRAHANDGFEFAEGTQTEWVIDMSYDTSDSNEEAWPLRDPDGLVRVADRTTGKFMLDLIPYNLDYAPWRWTTPDWFTDAQNLGAEVSMGAPSVSIYSAKTFVDGVFIEFVEVNLDLAVFDGLIAPAVIVDGDLDSFQEDLWIRHLQAEWVGDIERDGLRLIDGYWSYEGEKLSVDTREPLSGEYIESTSYFVTYPFTISIPSENGHCVQQRTMSLIEPVWNDGGGAG